MGLRKWFLSDSHVTRLAKCLAHFELYKSIVNLAGCVVECGVYKGASLIRFCTFRNILEYPYSRKIIGYDAFGRFPESSEGSDREFVRKFEAAGGRGISIDELREVFSEKSFENYELIQGDIVMSVPKYVAEHPEFKIALLHIDVDVYNPTVVILGYFYERVVKGGLIVFDDYGTVAGKTRAID